MISPGQLLVQFLKESTDSELMIEIIEQKFKIFMDE